MSATINIMCYKSKTLSNGEHPLMIRICKDGKKKYKSLGISVNPDFWDFQKNRPKTNCPNKELILKIILEKETEFQKQILELKSEQKEYTVSTLLISKDEQVKKKTVSEFYAELIAQFKSNGKGGNARIYNDSLRSLNNFTGNRLNIPFIDVNLDFLLSYEKWLRLRSCKETTISLLFRTLRSVYNKAVESDNVGKTENPFAKFKVSKFDTTTQKRAIAKDEIKRIMNINLDSKRFYIRFSKDIFVFSYLCGGINFTDIANLKKDNIIENRLIYVRQKTQKKISVPLNSEAIAIIDKYSYSKSDCGYLFPILDKRKHLTEQQRFNRIHKAIAKVNLCLKEIAKDVGIDANVSTYTARHSFATVLKRSGVSTSIISESLGHSSEKITQIYLDSFENSQIDAAMANLL